MKYPVRTACLGKSPGILKGEKCIIGSVQCDSQQQKVSALLDIILHIRICDCVTKIWLSYYMEEMLAEAKENHVAIVTFVVIIHSSGFVIWASALTTDYFSYATQRKFAALKILIPAGLLWQFNTFFQTKCCTLSA